MTIGSTKDAPATVRENVYIGPHVFIVENVKIGKNVIIGSGTVVINDVPDNAMHIGKPDRIILY